MRKSWFALVSAAIVLGWMVAPASGITRGELDNGEHPYVGFVVSFVHDPAALPGAPGWFLCSGTALDDRTFLTAGHCTYTVGDDAWVSFDETNPIEGWPRAIDFPDEASLFAARSAWLDANPAFTSGTAIADPRYQVFAEFPVNHDVGVVELDADAPLTSFGELAPLGTAEAIVAAGGPTDALIQTVGYGITDVHPRVVFERIRHTSMSRIVELNSTVSRGGNLHTSNDASNVGGKGGSCSGDSGGPLLVPDTDKVLAVVSFGNSNSCGGADYSWRVDTASSREFLEAYVD